MQQKYLILFKLHLLISLNNKLSVVVLSSANFFSLNPKLIAPCLDPIFKILLESELTITFLKILDFFAVEIVLPRKEFIESRAESVTNLDI